tara:strand:- start:18809 stop:19681 length:873 start_codon:yes stop_codon:yes gene_type:complete
MTDRKKTLKISYVNYFGTYNPSLRTPDIFSRIFPKTKYEIILDNSNPDIIISNSQRCPIRKDLVKSVTFFHTGENYRPNYSQYDYTFAFDRLEDRRHIRVTSLSYYGLKRFIKNYDTYDINDIFNKKTKFCCFLVSNPGCRTRNKFFEKLNKYKKVDSGGRYKNNIGRRIISNTPWVKEYKFIITFENGSYPGYCTEKIGVGFKANTIPIYWGDETVNVDYNDKSFINCHNYSNFDEAIQKIIELDNNDEMYKNMLLQPWLKDNKIQYELSDEYYIKRFNSLLDEISNKL